MFDRFMQDVSKHPAKVEVKLDLSQNMVLNPQLLWNKLSNIDTIEDSELYTIIRNYIDRILDEVFDNKNQQFIGLFTKPKFIQCLTQALYNIKLSDIQRQKLNKMAYDYLVKTGSVTDNYVASLLTMMAKVVNRDIIPKLCGYNIPEASASMMAMARFSSSKPIINVRRLNHILMQQPLSMITEQLVIDIYCALFDHMLEVFEGVMLDVISPNTMSSDQNEIYGIITLATLDIFEALPMNALEYGLSLFIEDKQVLYPDNHIRINLESCAQSDYPRFLQAIDNLKVKGIYMPLS